MGKQLLHVDVIKDINLLHILYHVLYLGRDTKSLLSFVQGVKENTINYVNTIHC